MIPIRDTVKSQTAPIVTVALMAINVIVFLHEVALGPYLERFVFAYGLIPRRFVYWPGDPFDAARFLPLLTSMFWHGGWLHLIGNMLYLWVFGDNVEDRLGHLRYLIFYLLAGTAAGLTQVALNPDGFWFLMQLLMGLGSLGGPDTGGIAVWAHVGGFLAGVVLVKLMEPRRGRPRTLEVPPW